jgi:hypothetical protein
MTGLGQRSPYIEGLRARLERAAVRDQDLDREVAADWFAVDHQTWRQLDGVTPRRKPAARGGGPLPQTRPALIIQNDVSNRLGEITIVAPITSTVRCPLHPVHVLPAVDRNTGFFLTSVAP